VFGLGLGELLIILIAVGVVYTFFFSPPVRRRLSGGAAPPKPVAAPPEPVTAPPTESAEEILARRFARGEIDQREYDSMRAAIGQNRDRI
jgi:hypothetical protein